MVIHCPFLENLAMSNKQIRPCVSSDADDADPSHDVRMTYEVWSKTYDASPNPLIPVEEMAVRSLLRTLDFQDVLDAATGTGRHAIYLAGQGGHVTAVDVSEGMLNEARRKAQQQQLSIDFRREDMTVLPFPDETFDLVLCALALCHIADLAISCQELVRVLRRGGNLIISDLHPYHQANLGPAYREELVAGHELFFPQCHAQIDDYLDALRQTGATVVACLDIPYQVLTPESDLVAIPAALLLWVQKDS
jgi:ubiquinone/menaquinone biosynthesis C-methylase UbiE